MSSKKSTQGNPHCEGEVAGGEPNIFGAIIHPPHPKPSDPTKIKTAGKTLLKNWVEERQCNELGFGYETQLLAAAVNKSGHKSLLVQNSRDHLVRPTMQSDYTWPENHSGVQIGEREKQLQRLLFSKAKEEFQLEKLAQIKKIELKSEMKDKFIPYQPMTPTPLSCAHNPASYQSLNAPSTPQSYWRDNLSCVAGTKPVVLSDPHRRCSNFSTPLSEYKYAPQKND